MMRALVCKRQQAIARTHIPPTIAHFLTEPTCRFKAIVACFVSHHAAECANADGRTATAHEKLLTNKGCTDHH